MTTNKILITGIAGLIGSHLSRYLLDKGYEVYGIDDLSGGYRDFVDPRVVFFQIDLLNTEHLSECFNFVKPDYVYHLAAYAAEGLSPFIRNFNYSSNLLCSTNVINECIKHKVKKIIFTSSMAVYGRQSSPFFEDMTPEPIDPYGIAKYSVEMDLKQAHEQFGLEYSIVRPHNVVGIYQNIWDKYRNVIGIWIRKVLNRENICIFGDGKQTRAFSDVKFCLEPLEKLMTGFNGEVFNLGSNKNISLIEVALLVQKIANQFNFKPKIEYLEQRHEAKYAFCNHAKAEGLLDFKDNTNLEEVISQMFEWAIGQPERKVKEMVYELPDKVYEFWK